MISSTPCGVLLLYHFHCQLVHDSYWGHADFFQPLSPLCLYVSHSQPSMKADSLKVKLAQGQGESGIG